MSFREPTFLAKVQNTRKANLEELDQPVNLSNRIFCSFWLFRRLNFVIETGRFSNFIEIQRNTPQGFEKF